MKEQFSHIGLGKLCGWFGITRQAYYQYCWNVTEVSLEQHLILKEVAAIRKNHPKMGGRKLYEKLREFLQEHNIKMGRDALFTLLSKNDLLVKKRRRKARTTHSFHWLRKYPNLIKGFTPTGVNQLWVSDITYWKITDGYLYISFVTDAFSHKIVGYQVAESLEAVETIKALEMAISGLMEEPDSHFRLVHHSDRGLQYCSKNYVKLLQDNKIQVSMTEQGDPLENAIAERVNGIIKDEYLNNHKVNSISEAKELLNFVITLYNDDRPHMSIGNLTPSEVHKKNLKTERLWKSYFPKRRSDVNSFQDYNQTVNEYQD